MFCHYSKLVTLYKIGELHFRLLGANGFQAKAKKERFTAASSRCRQNLKYENFTSSFGRLRQKIAPKSVPHVQHDYFSSFNKSNHGFVTSIHKVKRDDWWSRGRAFISTDEESEETVFSVRTNQ